MLFQSNAFPTPKTVQRRWTRRGQSIVEYLMMTGAVAVVSIGAFITLGNSFGDLMGCVLAGLQGQIALAGTSSSGSHPAGGGAGGNPSEGRPFKMILPSGREIVLPAMPEDIQTSLQTAGANGSTNVLSVNIQAIAQQLLKDGEITPAQANALVKLANAGSEMAKVEKLLEDGMKQAASFEEFKAMKFEYNGVLYSPLQLQQMVGYNNVAVEYQGKSYSPPQLIKLLGKEGAAPYLKDSYFGLSDNFSTLRDEAQASGALDEPVIALVVNFLSKEILQLGNGVQGAIGDGMNAKGYDMSTYNDLVLSYMAEYIPDADISDINSVPDLKDGVANLTQNDSGDICNSGGSNCPP